MTEQEKERWENDRRRDHAADLEAARVKVFSLANELARHSPSYKALMDQAIADYDALAARKP